MTEHRTRQSAMFGINRRKDGLPHLVEFKLLNLGSESRGLSHKAPMQVRKLKFKSSPRVCFLDYLKKMYLDLYRVGSATYHNLQTV